MNKEVAKKILLEEGYIIKPLFQQSIPPLQEDIVDLSIVVPVYNSEHLLPICLDSLFHQKTDYRYEVICVNDGSTDKSGEVLDNYAKQYANMRVITQRNGGISVARNSGIAAAIGTYIGFVDNDDYVSENYVEKLIAAAYRNKADVVQVGYDRVTPNGKVLWEYRKGDFVISASQYESHYDLLRGTIWGGCFRKAIFDKIRFPEGYWYEDMINKLVLLRLTNVLVSIDECLYYWVARSDSAMSTYWKSYKIQSVDQVFLPIAFINYARDVLGLENDALMNQTLVHEYSYILYLRTHKLPAKLRKAIYMLAKNQLQEFAIRTGDRFTPNQYRTFEQWNLICLFHFIVTEIKKRL